MSYPGKLRIIAGKHKGRKIPVLSMKTLRPTPDRVRETLFNWLQGTVSGARCVNLFAGTGILGFEALSRGAQWTVMVDSALNITEMLKKVRSELNMTPDECPIIHQDVLSWLSQGGHQPADLIFMDPPFDSDLLEKSLQCLPESGLLGAHTKIYTELPIDKPVPVLEGYEVRKSQKAGQVGYYLLAKV